MTDPIADMLTRIRNAYKARFEKVEMPSSKMKMSILQALKNEGYVKGYKVLTEGNKALLQVSLKYDAHKKPAVAELRRMSKPGRRIYVNKDEIPADKKRFGTCYPVNLKGNYH